MTAEHQSALNEDDLDARGKVILDSIEQAHLDGLLYGGDADVLDPSGWTKSTFPEAARRIAAALAAPAPGLNDAWAEAEAVLPVDALGDPWDLELRSSSRIGYTATASVTLFGRSEGFVSVDGPTPAAALLALAARLREQRP